MAASDEPVRPARTLSDAASLAALAHPLRSRLMDALAVDGPATASALAARTGQAVGNASHHLKVLAAAGLIVEAPDLARDRRERWWKLADPGTRWTTSALDPATQVVAREAEAVLFQRQVERTRDWLVTAPTDPVWDDAAFATQGWLHLTPDELRAFQQELQEVVHRWQERTRGAADGSEAPDRESVFWFARGFPCRP